MLLLSAFLIVTGIIVETAAIAIASKKKQDLKLGLVFSGIGFLCLGLILLTLQAGGTLQSFGH